MKPCIFAIAAVFAISVLSASAQTPSGSWPEQKTSDRFETSQGPLEIVFLGHASLIIHFQNSHVYIDPVRQYADFSKYPRADLILVTHEHGDHLDPAAIAALSTPATRIILPEASRKKLGKGEALAHYAEVQAAGLTVRAVPAYNVSPDRQGFHPKSRGDNGYLITAGSGIDVLRIYIAGDTEPIPEMANLGQVDIAFLPMNLPYTMTPEQVAAAARTIHPRILYPYHFGKTDTNRLVSLLAEEKGIEVRIRKLE